MPEKSSVFTSEEKIREKFFYLMKKKKVKQGELAKYLGVSNQTISNYKTGRCKIPLKCLIALVLYCDLSNEEIGELFEL